MVLIVLWVIFAIVVAVAADSRGRNPIGWFFLACLISPLIAVILLALMPPLQGAKRIPFMALSRGEVREWQRQQQSEGRTRQCPYCAEFIKPEAIVCKHCGRDLPASTPVEAVMEGTDKFAAPKSP